MYSSSSPALPTPCALTKPTAFWATAPCGYTTFGSSFPVIPSRPSALICFQTAGVTCRASTWYCEAESASLARSAATSALPGGLPR